MLCVPQIKCRTAFTSQRKDVQATAGFMAVILWAVTMCSFKMGYSKVETDISKTTAVSAELSACIQ